MFVPIWPLRTSQSGPSNLIKVWGVPAFLYISPVQFCFLMAIASSAHRSIMLAKQECQNVWSSDKNETGAISVFYLHVCTCGYMFLWVHI